MALSVLAYNMLRAISIKTPVEQNFCADPPVRPSANDRPHQMQLAGPDSDGSRSVRPQGRCSANASLNAGLSAMLSHMALIVENAIFTSFAQ